MSRKNDFQAGGGRPTSRTSKLKDAVTFSAQDIEARLRRLPRLSIEEEEERQDMLAWIRSVVDDDSYLRELEGDGRGRGYDNTGSSLELVLSSEASSSAEQGEQSPAPEESDTEARSEGSDTETDCLDTGSPKLPSIGHMPTLTLTPLSDSERAPFATDELAELRAHVVILQAHVVHFHTQNQQLREQNDKTWNLAKWTYAHIRGLDGRGGLGLHPVLELVLIFWISMFLLKWMMVWFA